MMSGRAGLSDAVRATKLGAFNFLEKPLSPETVLLALITALDLRQARKSARALREELGLTGQLVARARRCVPWPSSSRGWRRAMRGCSSTANRGP